MNIWQQLKNQDGGFIGLSPMDGLTDAPFRAILAKYCRPSVIFTEFINIDGMYFSREEMFLPLLYQSMERPVIAQIFGVKPELFYLGAQIVAELGFDGLDINMGCPSKSVAGRGAGAGLIKTPELAKEIIQAAKQGIADWLKDGISEKMSARALRKIQATKARLIELNPQLKFEKKNIPVSVKTRIGYSENEIATWIPELISAKPANITIHGRTFKQLYSGQADWNAIKAAADLIYAHNTTASETEQITVIGNGDCKNYEEAQQKAANYGLDGVLIGRAALGDPWVFLPEAERPKSLAEKLPLILDHIKAYEEILPHEFIGIRKHLAWYFKGFEGAPEMRNRLVRVSSGAEAREIIARFQSLTM